MATTSPWQPELKLVTSRLSSSLMRSFVDLSVDLHTTIFDARAIGDVKVTPWIWESAGIPPLTTPEQMLTSPIVTVIDESSLDVSRTALTCGQQSEK